MPPSDDEEVSRTAAEEAARRIAQVTAHLRRSITRGPTIRQYEMPNARTDFILSPSPIVQSERLKVLSAAQVERIKILATYLNTIGAGFAVTGVIGPVATYLYGTGAQTSRPVWQLGIEVGSLVGFSVVLHLLARRVLGRLDP